MKIKALLVVLICILTGCLPPLDSHVPKEVAIVRGKIAFKSTGRSEISGFFIENGSMKENAGGIQRFFSDYQRTLSHGLDSFLTFNLDGRQLAEISIAPLNLGFDNYFDISPDGKTIAFIASQESKGYRVDNLYAIDVDGNNLRNLTGYEDDYKYFGGVKFSPDGKKLLFNRARTRKEGATLFIRDIVSGETTDILAGKLKNGAEADWSPDGKSIVFVHIDESSFRNLYLLDLATKQVKQLTYFSPKYFGQVYHPSYSPWGDQICFALAARDKNAGSEIFAVNVDGSNLIRLTASKKTEHYPYRAADDYPDWGK